MGLRTQLKTACLALTATVNAALVVAGLDELSGMVSPDDLDTGRLNAPRIVVSMAGPRERGAYTSGKDYYVEERLTVEFTLQMEGTEDEALAYEDAILPVLRGAWAALETAVTLANLGEWYPEAGDLGQDDDGDDDRQRAVTMRFRALLEWT